MGWETRRGRRYFYRKKRVGSKVVSQYIGQSEYVLSAIQLGSQLDLWRQLERAEERRKHKEFIQELRQVDQAIDEYRAQVRQVVAAVLQQLGYHSHKGQWRMPRKMGEKDIVDATQEEIDEYERLARQAEKEAKPVDVERLSEFVLAHPKIFERPSQLARTTLGLVMDSGNATAVTKIFIKAEVAALRRSLGEADASPLEKLLIEDIAICWLRLQLAEQAYSNNTNNVSFKLAEYWERRLSATRKRYLQAVESLARVRRLLSRVGVQVNVAQQQVVMNTN